MQSHSWSKNKWSLGTQLYMEYLYQPPTPKAQGHCRKKKAGKVVGAIGERDVKYWLWDTQQSDYAMISYDYLHKTKPSKFQQEWGRGFWGPTPNWGATDNWWLPGSQFSSGVWLLVHCPCPSWCFYTHDCEDSNLTQCTHTHIKWGSTL